MPDALKLPLQVARKHDLTTSMAVSLKSGKGKHLFIAIKDGFKACSSSPHAEEQGMYSRKRKERVVVAPPLIINPNPPHNECPPKMMQLYTYQQEFLGSRLFRAVVESPRQLLIGSLQVVVKDLGKTAIVRKRVLYCRSIWGFPEIVGAFL